MPTEEQIKELAYAIWEKEGRPEGKDAEHYFRAKQILEQQETSNVIELGPPLPTLELAPQPSTIEFVPPPVERRKFARRKKKQRG